MIFSIAVNFNNIGNNKNIPFPSWSFARSPFWGDSVGSVLTLCRPGCTWSFSWVSGCRRWDDSEEQGLFQEEGVPVLQPLLGLGTMRSMGLQSFSWGVVAGVLESNRSLIRDLKNRRLRKVSWFGLDCPGLPAPLGLRLNCTLEIRFRTIRPRNGLKKRKGQLRIQHNVGI